MGNMSGNLLGMHDLFPAEKDWLFGTGGAFSPGWILHTVNVRDKADHDYSARVERGYKIMVRLNNGYGADGTIPAGDYGKFAEQCARFVQRSTGLRIAIIGNEPNHENERPQGKIIPPADYSNCFNLCYDAIKAVAPSVQVIPAAVAPYHAAPMKWTDYLLRMLNQINECDGISVHAYTRGHDSAYVRSNEKMADAPLQGTFRGFRTYMDALAAVPPQMSHLPAYLTECNPVKGWPQHNAHLISAMLQEIRQHNETARVTNKFHAMIAFRWHDFPPNPDWGIVRSEGTQQDFSEAASMDVFEPERTAQPASGGQHNIFFPSIPGPTGDDEPSNPQPDGPDVDWDPKLTERGVTYKPTGGNPGEPFWGLIWARYIPPEEAEGRHAVYVEVLDKQGRLMEGVPIDFYWADGDETKPSKDRQGWEAQDFLLWASGNAYDLEIGGSLPSDIVRGMGMGTIEEPHIGHHVAYRLRFQQFIAPLPMQEPEPDVDREPPQPPVENTPSIPKLQHPLPAGHSRRITQRFGSTEIDYSRFGLKGHNGVDFLAAKNTPIHAVDAGRVKRVGDDPDGYGLFVVLEHAWGDSLYAHLVLRTVKAGEVSAGQQIAFSGNSGNSTEPHLHLAIRPKDYDHDNGYAGYIDPLPYLDQTEGTFFTMAEIRKSIRMAASEFGLDWALFASLIWAESSYNIDAESDRGAQGLAQIIPATWAEWAPSVGAGDDPFDPWDNLRVGAAYLRWLLDQLGNEWSAVIAYNFGIGNVLGGNEPPEDTIIYVRSVLHGADLLRQWIGD